MSRLKAGWYKWPSGTPSVSLEDSSFGHLKNDPFFYDGKGHYRYLFDFLVGRPGRDFTCWAPPVLVSEEEKHNIEITLISHTKTGVEVEFTNK